MKVLVTGATGNLGSATARALKSKGIDARAGARNPDNLHIPIDTVRFDYHDTSTFGPALEGVDGVFLQAPPMDASAPEILKPVINQAGADGLEHIVLISALGVDANQEAPLRKVERVLMESDVPWTILRNNAEVWR